MWAASIRPALAKASRRQRGIRQVAADTLRLSGAAGLAQVITLAAAPLISRLYEPADFGRFAVATAIITLLLPLASLRYEWALVLPDEEDRAVDLLALCVVLVAVVTLALAALLAIVVPFAVDEAYLTKRSAMELVLAVAVMGLHAVIVGWFVRQRAIAQIALMRFATVIGTAIAQIAFARLFGGASGLLLGFVTGHAIGIAVAAGNCRHALVKALAASTLSSLKRIALEYRAFAIFSAPGGTINALGYQIISLLTPALYGQAVAGQSALAQRVVGQPAVLVGAAVNQVFWADAARLFVDAPDRLWHVFLRMNLILLAAMIPAVVLTFLGSEIFGFIFGAAWKQAGTFAGVFILAQILGLPAHATTCLHGYRLNSWMSAWDIGRLCAVGLAFVIAWRFSLSPLACVAVLTTASSIANIILFGLNAAVILRAKSAAARQPQPVMRPPAEAESTT